jgi:hypothetical protein
MVMPAFDIRFVSWDCCNEFLDVIDNRELLISASYAFCMEACVVLMFACSLVSFRADASFRDIEDAAEAMDASLDARLVAELAEARLADRLSEDWIDAEIAGSVTGTISPSCAIAPSAAPQQ